MTMIMTFNNAFALAKGKFDGGDFTGYNGDFAIQVNITGDGEGSFYIAFKNGALSVEPYEYNDRDVILTATAENFLKIADGSLNAVAAFTTGKLKLNGSIEKALELNKLIETAKKNKRK